jgi:hypothetical protein
MDDGLHADLTGRVVGCAIEVHRHLGAGLIHLAQMPTCLRVAGLRVGLLLNFNSVVMKDGIRRVAL